VTDRQKAIAAILAAIPALLIACSQWIRADAAKREKAAAYESYGEYVTDQLHRDEALLRALEDCYARRGWTYGLRGKVAGQIVGRPDEEGLVLGAVKMDDRQAQVVLDELAKREGWGGEE
jgi:hypothetical protein